VLGQIRSAIGSSQLLMKQKLKQYIGLVDSAQSQTGHRRTTAGDLQVRGARGEGKAFFASINLTGKIIQV